MKTICPLLLTIILAAPVVAQDAKSAAPASPPAPPANAAAAAQEPPPAPVPLSKATMDKIAAMTPIFDGKTLDGWIQVQNNSWSFGAGDIADLLKFAKRLSDKADPISAYLYSQLSEASTTSLAGLTADSTNATAARRAISRDITKVVASPSLFDQARFAGVKLSPETEHLLQTKPVGYELLRLNKMLLADAYPAELKKVVAPTAWTVKDGAMASTGADRGVIFTAKDYSHYRLIFNMRHVSGNHEACVLVFGTRETPHDALGAVQFQVPNGGNWNYRPGINKGGVGFTRPARTKYNKAEWSQVEILVDAAAGKARMAVAQPVGTKGVVNLIYDVPGTGQTGPIAWQIHNAGLFDEYKDARVELDPKEDKLITAE